MNNINELKEIKKVYKSLYNRQIYAYKLQIIDELECILEEKITDEDYMKLFNAIENTYLKLDNVSIYAISKCAVDHIRRILDNDETFDLKYKSCFYD